MEVEIQTENALLKGILTVPEEAKGIVLFVNGSGSSRLSPRNQFAAQIFHDSYLATLLLDLLTHEEEKIDLVTAEIRFDIDQLTQRLLEVSDWVLSQEKLKMLKIGYFGSSTGTAAALNAAAEKSDKIHAVVSKGGRPDLAHLSFSKLQAPSLFIVGEQDFEGIERNKRALEAIACEKRLAMIEKASHYFEEPGTMEEATVLAADWFAKYLQ